MKKTIIGCFKNEKQIQQVIEQLGNQNYSLQDVSLICPSKGSSTPSSSPTKASWTKEGNIQEETSQQSSPSKNSYSKLNQYSTINIPGMGSCNVAGPVKSYLSSSSHGGNQGSFLTSFFTNCGITESDARKYEDNLKKGHCILMYQNEKMDQLNQFRDLCTKAGAQELSMSAGAEKSKKAKV
jgi:hypothetical protein